MPRPFKSLSWVLKWLAFALSLKWLACPHGVIVHVWTKGNDICLVWLRVFPRLLLHIGWLWWLQWPALYSIKTMLSTKKNLLYCSHNIWGLIEFGDLRIDLKCRLTAALHLPRTMILLSKPTFLSENAFHTRANLHWDFHLPLI